MGGGATVDHGVDAADQVSDADRSVPLRIGSRTLLDEYATERDADAGGDLVDPYFTVAVAVAWADSLGDSCRR
jgi:hypothetical protein